MLASRGDCRGLLHDDDFPCSMGNGCGDCCKNRYGASCVSNKAAPAWIDFGNGIRNCPRGFEFHIAARTDIETVETYHTPIEIHRSRLGIYAPAFAHMLAKTAPLAVPFVDCHLHQ